jgi:hypothetical protein
MTHARIKATRALLVTFFVVGMLTLSVAVLFAHTADGLYDSGARMKPLLTGTMMTATEAIMFALVVACSVVAVVLSVVVNLSINL